MIEKPSVAHYITFCRVQCAVLTQVSTMLIMGGHFREQCSEGQSVYNYSVQSSAVYSQVQFTFQYSASQCTVWCKALQYSYTVENCVKFWTVEYSSVNNELQYTVQYTV